MAWYRQGYKPFLEMKLPMIYASTWRHWATMNYFDLGDDFAFLNVEFIGTFHWLMSSTLMLLPYHYPSAQNLADDKFTLVPATVPFHIYRNPFRQAADND